MDISEKVKSIIRRFKTLDPFELANCMDILVLDVPLPKDTGGFFQHYKRIKIIYLNEDLNEYERKIVLAHEIAHSILHPNLNRIFLDNHTHFSGDRFENEANLLASYMILPDNELKGYLEYGSTKYQISKITGIDIKFIDKRTGDI